MNFRALYRISIWLFAMSMIAFLVLRAGRLSYSRDHSSTNFGPSGTSAFVELLRQSGYSVQDTPSANFAKDSVLILPVAEEDLESVSAFVASKPKVKSIVVLRLPNETSDSNISKPISSHSADSVVGYVSPLQQTGEAPKGWNELKLGDYSFACLAHLDSEEYGIFEVAKSPEQTMLKVSDSRMILNGNIDRNDNAGVMMGYFEGLFPKSSKIVWNDQYVSSDAQVGLIEKLGPFYVGFYQQLKVLFVVILLTLSIRFGFAPEIRARQRGSKELLDGLANFSKRKKNYQWALRAVIDRTLVSLEKKHRLSRADIASKPERVLSKEDATKLKTALEVITEPMEERQALEQAQKIHELT